MKIIKIFGIVAGIHLFALILIFANPGCSSTAKSAAGSTTDKPSPDTASSAQPPLIAPSENLTPTPVTNSGNMASSETGVRFSPTRPGSAASTALEAKPVADVTPATTYTVAKGDSLWIIAKKNHTTVAEIKAANNLKDSSLRLGQKLVIPGKEVAQGVSTPADTTPAAKPALTETPAAKGAAAAGSVTHKVMAGESLGVIARKYHVKVGDVATANNISDPTKIRVGQELVIPAAKSGSTKPSTASSAKTPAANAQTAPATQPATSGPATSTPAAPTNTTPTIIISDTPTVGPTSGPAMAMPSGSPSTEAPPVIQVQETPTK